MSHNEKVLNTSSIPESKYNPPLFWIYQNQLAWFLFKENFPFLLAICVAMIFRNILIIFCRLTIWSFLPFKINLWSRHKFYYNDFRSIWIDINIHFYHPQRSCSKVMFLHLSVSHSVHRGLSATRPQADTPKADPLGRHPLWAYTPLAQCMLGYSQQASGTHPTGMQTCFFRTFNIEWRNIYPFLMLMVFMRSRIRPCHKTRWQ